MPDETESRDERWTRLFIEWWEWIHAGVPIVEWPGEVKHYYN